MNHKHRRLAGCVPIKGRAENLQVMLITSRRHPNRLVFPKGGVKRDESPESAALRETWEEAGIRGRILHRLSPSDGDKYSDDEEFCCEEAGSVENLQMSERTEGRRNSELAVQACRWYVMEVWEETEEWPERGQRERLWFPLDKAQQLDNIRDNVRDLLKLLESWNGRQSVPAVTSSPHDQTQCRPPSSCQII